VGFRRKLESGRLLDSGGGFKFGDIAWSWGMTLYPGIAIFNNQAFADDGFGEYWAVDLVQVLRFYFSN